MTSRLPESPFAVVGIGASAGGLDALVALLETVDASFGGAIVVVQHLLPDHRSHLAEILGRKATLPVVEACDGMLLLRGCVHVIAAGASLTVEGTTLRSVRDDEAEVGHAIDRFFVSLARSHGAHATAVVLSGVGSDGAAGALRVRQSGGRVLVQEPHSALHESMPLASIKAGAADEVMTPAQIGRALSAAGARLVALDAAQGEPGPAFVGESTASIEHVAALIRDRTGIDLRGYRMSPLALRVQRRIAHHGFHGLGPYLALLHDDPDEIHVLVDGLPIHVTSFFRDPEAWDELARLVIAPLVATIGADPVRVWTAACATGEEAYSVAMSLEEAGASLPGRRDYRVFATDAIAEIVTRASRGVFPSSALVDLAPARRTRFFTAATAASADDWEVRHALRSKVVFAPHDLLTDPPFASCDLITCRNFLIYLEAGTQDRVLALLRGALKPGGVLFLGAAESLPSTHQGFEVPGFDTVSRRWRIYRRTGMLTVRSAAGTQPSAGFDVATIAAHALAPMLGLDLGAATVAAIAPNDAASSREELQILNRELESINGRLAVANRRLADLDDRLHDRADELASRGDATQGVALTLCVDDALRVRWFTPATSGLMPLRGGDAGRPITDFAERHADDAFIATLRRVIATGESADDEVVADDGRCYRRRVSRHGADTGDLANESGAIVNFVDVTALKAAEGSLDDAQARALLLHSLRDALRTPGDRGGGLASMMTFIATTIVEPLAATLGAVVIDVYATDEPPPDDEGLVVVRRWIAARVADGRDVRIDDVDTLPDAARDAWRAIDVRSVLATSLATTDQCAIVLVVRSAAPRTWTGDDAALVASVGGLVQDAVDRSLAAAALDDSRTRLARALAMSTAVVAAGVDEPLVADLE